MSRRSVSMLLVGLVAGLLMAPVASSAANSLVAITGGGNLANVDKAHRLMTSSADASALVNVMARAGSGCVNIFTVPKGKTFILKTVDFVDPGSQANAVVGVHPAAGCAGNPIAQAFLFLGSQVGTTSDHVDLGEGAAIPAGRVVTASNNNTLVDVLLHGYLLPNS